MNPATATLLTLLLVPPPRAFDEVVETYPDGTVRARYEVDDTGRKSGPYLEYHENGKLHIRGHYRAGAWSGTYQEFHANGRKSIEAKYRGGLLVGKYEERDEEGRTEYVAHFDDGVLDGKASAFDGKQRLVTQKWKDGTLVEIEGIAPYPRPLTEIRTTLAALLDPARPLPGSPAGPEAFATSDQDEAADPGLRAAREGALRNLVAYRYLCGVPHEGMSLDPEFNRLTTMGARLCAAIGRLDHTPDNPGWPDSEYRDGYIGTSHSNLASGSDVARSVHMYMDDSDPSNIDRVGHRIWCLARRLSRVGFGRSGKFSAMYVRDTSGRGGGPDAVLYPPAGYVPAGFFGPRHAWSLSFRDGVIGDVDEVTIQVRPLDDRLVPGAALELDHRGRRGATLIFRPAGLDATPDSAYLVRIDGLRGRYKKGLEYLVHFAARTPRDE